MQKIPSLFIPLGIKGVIGPKKGLLPFIALIKLFIFTPPKSL